MMKGLMGKKTVTLLSRAFEPITPYLFSDSQILRHYNALQLTELEDLGRIKNLHRKKLNFSLIDFFRHTGTLELGYNQLFKKS
jgi:hypothetical protein